ncbi:MAG: DEAD/DEAH box helicase, partial [Candidatus Nanoarchaeia archaeon]
IMKKNSQDTFNITTAIDYSLFPQKIQNIVKKMGIKELRPSQQKAITQGLFTTNKHMLISAPTASGKTAIAEFAMLQTILEQKKRVIYVVPLKALASEKYKDFEKLYSQYFSIHISIGEVQTHNFVKDFDLLLVTAEKLDSLLRHSKEFIKDVGLIIIDEIHLLNDETRGPTLEVLITLFKMKYSTIRMIGLSATIKNCEELANWLNAELVYDTYRPVELHHYTYYDNKLSFQKKS